ncbi:MAG: DNA adenine methylase [Treponema sp.]|nr:DNA adenine methylase [Treponema sp.]
MITRPLVRYHGSKWAIAPWIISFIPSHRVYAEPYGGGGAILLRKARCHEEIYNDIDSDIVNLFRVTRDSGSELKKLLENTPFSRDEYLQAYKPADNPIEQARRTVIRAFMGRANTGATGKISENGSIATGFRANTRYCGKSAAKVWASYPEALDALIDRLKGVVIENRNALEIFDLHDTDQTLFYVDPPYLFSVRDAGTDYRYEMTEQDHIELAKKLHEIKGSVILSGYHSELYNELYKDWTVKEKNTYCDSVTEKERIEVLWLKNIDIDLFGGELL